MTEPALEQRKNIFAPSQLLALPDSTFFLFVGALAVIVWSLVINWPRPIVDTDFEQARLDVALPAVTTNAPISQTFRARHDGLAEIEILVAQLSSDSNAQGLLTLQLLDEEGALVVAESWPSNQLAHNRPLILRFDPQRRSAGRAYTLVLRGDDGNPFSAWGYSLDVYDDGDLQLAQESTARELRFTTRYQLEPVAALATVAQMLWDHGKILILALFLMFMPGCLLLLVLGRRLPTLDRGAWWGLALVSGVAAWPLLWFWLTLVGARWTRLSLAAFLIAGWLLVLYLYRSRSHAEHARARHHAHPDTKWFWFHPHLLLAFLLLLALCVRLLAVRDLAFPPWVDSSRHALITAVMVGNGQTISSYAPYLPVERFPYHFGFHTLSASLTLLSGWSLPETMLIFGQLLNALVTLSVYTAAWLLIRRRRAALLAACLVAFPFFFPAYYATWGRFTQLTGVLLLPPLLALTWLTTRGGRGWRRVWYLLGLLAAGLCLIHFRVFLAYVPFAALAWLLAVGRGGRHLALAALLGLLLVGPRLVQLLRMAGSSGLLTDAGESYAELPVGYITAGWERHFLIVGGLAFLWAAVAGLWGKRWGVMPVALVAWMSFLMLFLSGRVPQIPAVWLINLNSVYILFFVPLALVLATAFARLWRWLATRPRPLQIIANLTLGAVLAALLLFGARQQVDILNQTTILTRPQDLAALAWVDKHLPPDAHLAVNSWQWLGPAWAASDGGAWLVPLTGRMTTTPPVDYTSSQSLALQVMRFNQKAFEVEDWSDGAAADWLKEQGVTHIFVGARGGFFDPAALSRNPKIEKLYGQQGAFIFALH